MNTRVAKKILTRVCSSDANQTMRAHRVYQRALRRSGAQHLKVFQDCFAIPVEFRPVKWHSGLLTVARVMRRAARKRMLNIGESIVWTNSIDKTVSPVLQVINRIKVPPDMIIDVRDRWWYVVLDHTGASPSGLRRISGSMCYRARQSALRWSAHQPHRALE